MDAKSAARSAACTCARCFAPSLARPDPDVDKVLQGVAYTLHTAPNAELEARASAIIAAAQQPDGYLNTYWTMVAPAERWSDIAHGHELYCAGHLIEAGIAYARATGKRKLLDVAIRFADHIDREFGTGKRLDPCGHPEIELALIELWRETKEPRYLALAQFFVDERGDPRRERRFGEYAQDHRPVREQREATGHAVRAMYLYSAMTDLAGITGDHGSWDALRALSRDVIETKMYATGGIGSAASNEGFTKSFDLPNDTAYCETCASIGMALWNQRMFLATGEAAYAEIVERELYNGVLAGVSLAGDAFFYDNPLASRGDDQRVPWFDCSCCPTNLARFIPAIGEYTYAVGDDELYIAQLISSRTELEIGGQKVRVEMASELPWKFGVEIAVTVVEPARFTLRLRSIPASESIWTSITRPDGEWTHSSACAGSQPPNISVVPSDAIWLDFRPGRRADSDVNRTWLPGTTRIRIGFTRDFQRLRADSRVAAAAGRVAIQHGPLVYCAEAIDNGGRARNLVLPRVVGASESPTKIRSKARDDLLGGVLVLEARGLAVVGRNADGKPVTKPRTITLVPYYAWANRGPGEMVVWLPETPELAEVPE